MKNFFNTFFGANKQNTPQSNDPNQWQNNNLNYQNNNPNLK